MDESGATDNRQVEVPLRTDELVGVSIDTTAICNLRGTTCSLENWYSDKGVNDRRDVRARPEMHEQLVFWNLLARSLHEIWEQPEYVEWRARLRAGEVFDYCGTCLKRAGVICPLKHWRWLASNAPARVDRRSLQR